MEERKMRAQRAYSAVLAVVMAIGMILFGFATPAQARSRHSSSKEKTYRIATYGLAGLGAYGLVKGNTLLTVAGAAGTYFAHKKWKDEVNARHRGRYVRRHR
jgi:hypothetical protein